MNEAKRNAMVGGFMVVGLILLAWLFWIFGEAPEWLGTPGYRLAIDVVGVYGITESTVVELNGVPVGRVLGLEFKNKDRPRDVQIICSIDNEFSIPMGCVARVQPGGFGLARGRVSLIPRVDTDTPLPRDGSLAIRGSMVSAFSDVISDEMLDKVESAFANVGDLAKSLVPAAEGLQRLVEERSVSMVDNPPPDTEQLTANVATLIERMDIAFRAVNETIGDPSFREGVMSSISNIRQMTEDGKAVAASLRESSESIRTEIPALVADAKSTMNELKMQVTSIGQKTMPVLENLETASNNITRATHELTEGQGTLALFLKDPRFYEALTLSVQRLTDLVDTLKRMADIWERDNAAIRIRGAPL